MAHNVILSRLIKPIALFSPDRSVPQSSHCAGLWHQWFETCFYSERKFLVNIHRMNLSKVNIALKIPVLHLYLLHVNLADCEVCTKRAKDICAKFDESLTIACLTGMMEFEY